MSDNHERGFDLLFHSSTNKSTAFTLEEREELGLSGLLPARVTTMQTQMKRVLASLHRKAFDIERYIALQSLNHRNERLFYRTLIDNIEEMMPLVYTPTVGEACKEFAHIFRQTKGFYITLEHKGKIRKNLDNWPNKEVRVVVITDGERILGLGDLGANGMGIPIGKLALYTACAGIDPAFCLPVMMDVGTDNEEIRDDPMYLGIPKARIRGEEYDALLSEFIEAVQDKWPRALIQFEDFLTPNAYRLLREYREKIFCFNDDIQGTAAVALAGVKASTRLSGIPFEELRIMFLGAGSAATGIADLATQAFIASGMSESEARKRLSFVDIRGLLVSSRSDLLEHNLPYLQNRETMSFLDAIDTIKPHILIGATGAPGTFNEAVIQKMCEHNERPAIFALSNPTSKAECTAEQAYTWSAGKVIFASGSPFAPFTLSGRSHVTGQGNNAYIFPGIGLGAIACEATHISDDMFLEAAEELASLVSENDLESGAIYPPLGEIRDVSAKIALRVANQAYKEGLAQREMPADLNTFILDMMYDPSY